MSSPRPSEHLLIPFAACNAEAWQPAVQALPRESTRHLRQLLQGMKRVHSDEDDEHTLSPPHERALARAQGLATAATTDGLIPWAALDAASQLRADGTRGWAWITPCHWLMGSAHAILTDPAALALREDESRALLAAMRPYFETDGITLHYLTPVRWLAEAELFRTLPTASLDRVLGGKVDDWLPGTRTGERSAGPPQASSAPEGLEPAAPILLEQDWTGDRGEASREPRPARPRAAHEVASVGAIERSAGPPQASSAPSGGSVVRAATSVGATNLRRLQNEMQMLLYTHPLNDARTARTQLPVNSFWISGTGALASPPPRAPKEQVSVPRSLALAVFNDDWAAYSQAWAALDAGAVAQLLARQRAGEPVRLTLCGERNARTYETSRASLFAKISSLLAPQPICNVLDQL